MKLPIRIREWGEMIRLGGEQDEEGDIKLLGYCHFTKEMEHLCGKTMIIDVDEHGIGMIYDAKNDSDWELTPPMYEVYADIQVSVDDNNETESVTINNEVVYNDKYLNFDKLLTILGEYLPVKLEFAKISKIDFDDYNAIRRDI